MSAMTVNKLFDELQELKTELKRKDEEHQKEIGNKDEEIENKNERIKLLKNVLLKNNIELPSV